MMAYRSSVHETTKFTPFQMMFGRQVRLPIDIMFGTPEPTPSCPNQYVNQLRSNLENVTTLCKGILARNRSTRKISMTKNKLVPILQSMTWFGYTTLQRRVKTNLVNFTVHGKGHLKYLKSSMT